jgi:hypothetical protein
VVFVIKAAGREISTTETSVTGLEVNSKKIKNKIKKSRRERPEEARAKQEERGICSSTQRD